MYCLFPIGYSIFHLFILAWISFRIHHFFYWLIFGVAIHPDFDVSTLVFVVISHKKKLVPLTCHNRERRERNERKKVISKDDKRNGQIYRQVNERRMSFDSKISIRKWQQKYVNRNRSHEIITWITCGMFDAHP